MILDSVKSAFNKLSGNDTPTADIQGDAEAWFNERWNELKTAFVIYHMSCWESLLFYAGQSWIAWDENRKIWYPNTPTDDWVPRPKINRFSPTIDSICTNFNTIPEVECVPQVDLNGDLRVHGITEIATSLGQHFATVNGLRGSYKNVDDMGGYAAQLFTLCGNVATCVKAKTIDDAQIELKEPRNVFQWTCQTCDTVDEGPEAPPMCQTCGGPLVTDTVSRSQPVVGPDGTPQMQAEPRYEVCCEVFNPIYAFPRPGSKGMCDTPYFVHAERKTLDWIYYELGIEASSDYEFADGYSITFEHALNYYYTGYSSASIQAKDSALVKWAYIEPGKVKTFPQGLYGCMVNGEVQVAEPWDQHFIEHPITWAAYYKLPTVFMGRSVAFDLVEIQREKQSYESLIKLHGMTSAVDSIIVDENTMVSEITGRADKIIKWRSIGPGSQAPHRMQHGTLDEGIYKMRQALNEEFENISGAVAVFHGKQPGSITAGKAIEDLKSQAEAQFGKPVNNWHMLWKETIRKAVKTMQWRYTAAQIAEIIGPDKESAIINFKSCDLDTMTDWVVSGGGQPRSRAERKSEMMMLFDRGALDINDVNVKQEVFELFGETGMMKIFNADATRARYENKAMQNGQPAMVMPEIEGPEGLPVHLQIHTEQAKSLEFEKWLPPAKQLLLEHIIETRQALMVLQAAMAGPPPGAAAPKPGGTPPKEGASPAPPPPEAK